MRSDRREILWSIDDAGRRRRESLKSEQQESPILNTLRALLLAHARVGNACMDVVPVKLTRLETSDSPSHMANFAAQIKDKFLGLVDHVVAGCGLAGGGRAGAHQAAHRGTVQVLIFCLASYYIITKSFSCPTHACIHLVQYRALRI